MKNNFKLKINKLLKKNIIILIQFFINAILLEYVEISQEEDIVLTILKKRLLLFFKKIVFY